VTVSAIVNSAERGLESNRKSQFFDPRKTKEERFIPMKYGIAWLLGVPVSVLLVWWLIAHVL
jgi:hypothetical protein